MICGYIADLNNEKFSIAIGVSHMGFEQVVGSPTYRFEQLVTLATGRISLGVLNATPREGR